MWDFLELGYEAYQNNYPTVLKNSPPMLAMQQTIDLRGDILLVTQSVNDDSTLYTGFIMGCSMLWATAAPFCVGMTVVENFSYYL